MRETKPTINLMKSEFGKDTVKYLGHIVGQGQVRPLDAKIQTITQFPVTNSQKDLARFLGMAGYYINFCLNFFGNCCPAKKFVMQKGKVCLDSYVNWLLTKSSYYSKNPLF